MKKIYILFIVLAAFLVTGCQNDPIIYDGPEFVSFDTKSINKIVKEGEDGIVEIKAGVTRASKQDRTFNVVIDAANTTAVEGSDYSFITPKLTIPAGEYVGTIKIKGNYDNLTPEGVKLTLKLDGSESTLQAGTTTSVTINLTRFFEVTMDWLEGVWIWTDYDYSTGETTDDDTYPVEITKVSDTEIEIFNVWAGGKSIKASVNFTSGQISIEPDQVIYVHPNPSYGNITMDFFNGSTIKDAEIIGQCTFRGISIGGWTAYTWSGEGYFGRYKSEIVKYEE